MAKTRFQRLLAGSLLARLVWYPVAVVIMFSVLCCYPPLAVFLISVESVMLGWTVVPWVHGAGALVFFFAIACDNLNMNGDCHAI